jgi:hypothetical protein
MKYTGAREHGLTAHGYAYPRRRCLPKADRRHPELLDPGRAVDGLLDHDLHVFLSLAAELIQMRKS